MRKSDPIFILAVVTAGAARRGALSLGSHRSSAVYATRRLVTHGLQDAVSLILLYCRPCVFIPAPKIKTATPSTARTIIETRKDVV